MRLYNTLAKCVEEIVPRKPQKIKMYSCGPTVYRYIHVGNLRTFTMTDWIRRVYEYRGFKVEHVKNITDVGHMRMEILDRGEDKLIAQARKEGKTSQEIAEFYTQAFHQDEGALNILPAHVFPRATRHIEEMITIIEGLLEKGLAYEVNGYVYYDVKRFADYGKLSGNILEYMQSNTQEEEASERRNAGDFLLWKVAEPGREMAWESPWGVGFPGWHIECSAMSMKYLGPHFDIHTGGVDNIFPHHEDELAQSEGYTGQPFVNYWVHAQHLLADGQKMAKSTGNAYTRAEIEARGFDALALRYLYTTALYRSRLNFTFRALQAAQTALDRLRDRAYRLYMQADKQKAVSGVPLGKNVWRDAFLAEVENDLNMPRAMAVVWKMLHANEEDATIQLLTLLDMDRILGFGLKGYVQSDLAWQKWRPEMYLAAVPEQVAERVQKRDELRGRQEYERADLMREELAGEGYELRDGARGTLVLKRRRENEFEVLSSSRDVADATGLPDQYEFSVNLLAQNSRDDLERCVQSICRHGGTRSIELVIVDNGSTDDTLAYLEELARRGELVSEQGTRIGVRVMFADHNMGFAAGRNATLRASRGKFVVLMDTSIEVNGDIWGHLAETLDDPEIGLTGPYGLVSDDLREFREEVGEDVDAIEGYLMAFPRRLLIEVGWIEERFRFYRLMDVHMSFFFKAAGYRVVTVPELVGLLKKHKHREWYSLSEDERATRSKKNYDIFRARWHHGESLLVTNFVPQNRWYGHDHSYHLNGAYTHAAHELPTEDVVHTHLHQHWPDHAHEHPHYH